MNDVIQAILNAEDLPSPPGIALQMLELYNDPEVDVDEMTKLISADPVLTAKLLEYCNSPVFARSRGTDSIKQAVMLIGLKAVKVLALSFSLTQTVASDDTAFDYDHFWSRCIALAVVAEQIAMNRADRDQVFLLGLMLSIGQIGLAHTHPDRYNEIIALSLEQNLNLVDLEHEEWNVNHFEISAELLREWNFPQEMVAITAQFGSGEDAESESALNQIRTLKLALGMCETLFDPTVDEHQIKANAQMANEWFGFTKEEFSSLFDRATLTWTEFAGLLKFDVSNAVTFEELERKARKGIAQLSMGLHAENSVMQVQNEEFRQNSLIDPLTGLKNRRAYDEEMPIEWERASRLSRPFILVMVDIDNFKSVNDTYGHGIGDIALVAVSNLLKSSCRKYDSVYRFGGEEFVLAIVECQTNVALSVVERYRQMIEAMEIPVEDGTLKITASFGVGIHENPGPGSLAELLEDADRLLYQAKEAGRNRVCSNYNSPVPTMVSRNTPISQSTEPTG